MYNNKLDNFTVVLSERDGYSLISNKTGNHYDLLEGKSYNGISTSDIVFIMEANSEGYKSLIGYTFGASDGEACLEYCAGYITEYEETGTKYLN